MIRQAVIGKIYNKAFQRNLEDWKKNKLYFIVIIPRGK